MPKAEPIAIKCVIPNTGNPIGFAGGEGEAGTLKLSFYATGDEIQQLLALRGKELVVVLQETNAG